jgi:hypothetical protein
MDPELCSSCGAAAVPDSRGGLRCAGCGAVLAEPLTVCPRCGERNPLGADVCARCDTGLTVECPGCGRINWSGAERCDGCQRELDTLGHAFRPIDASVQMRREDFNRRVPVLREQEELKSRQRMEMLRDADRRRMQREAEREAQSKLRERRIIRGVGIAVVAFFIIVVLAVVSVQ